MRCLLGGMETVMVEVSPYDGGSGFTGELLLFLHYLIGVSLTELQP